MYTSTLVKSTLGPTIGKPSLSIARVVTELKLSVKPISGGLSINQGLNQVDRQGSPRVADKVVQQQLLISILLRHVRSLKEGT